MCAGVSVGTVTGPSGAVAAVVDVNYTDDPAHPCPICLVNEDDHGACGQCFGCGRLYCGECTVAETMGRIEN